MFEYILGVSPVTSDIIFLIVIAVLLLINGWVEHYTEKDMTIGDDNDTC
jgi:hypothetical protein